MLSVTHSSGTSRDTQVLHHRTGWVSLARLDTMSTGTGRTYGCLSHQLTSHSFEQENPDFRDLSPYK
ncbi:hypothetical protein QQF64_031963 [Cirrhinus molitorella]|uniref:Uncharacterized protein n=1 Tax=Cirrhinus molitorella TaxID=172907 RepID=A0ABR3MYG4_9TELE